LQSNVVALVPHDRPTNVVRAGHKLRVVPRSLDSVDRDVELKQTERHHHSQQDGCLASVDTFDLDFHLHEVEEHTADQGREDGHNVSLPRVLAPLVALEVLGDVHLAVFVLIKPENRHAVGLAVHES